MYNGYRQKLMYRFNSPMLSLVLSVSDFINDMIDGMFQTTGDKDSITESHLSNEFLSNKNIKSFIYHVSFKLLHTNNKSPSHLIEVSFFNCVNPRTSESSKATDNKE